MVINSPAPGFFRVVVGVVVGGVVSVVVVGRSALALSVSTLIVNVRVREVAAEKILILSWLPYTSDQELI